MNLTVLLIAAYIPLLPILFLIIRTGSFGRGSGGTFLKLFFLGIAAAVPAFLMEAGGMVAVSVLLRLFSPDAFGGKLALAAAALRYILAGALIEEVWKFFVLRTSTWRQMTMDTVVDGIAASAVVGIGFSAALYGAWQAAWYVVPADMEALHSSMPAFLSAGAVLSFLYALLFILSHFGFSGFMGAIYSAAKRSEQKSHGKRAGFMLLLTFLLPLLVHSLCAALMGYGMEQEKVLWVILGFAAQVILAVIMIGALISASDDAREAAAAAAAAYQDPDAPVDFADSEDFAEFAEAAGRQETEEEGGTGFLPWNNAPDAASSEGEISSFSPEEGQSGPDLPEGGPADGWSGPDLPEDGPAQGQSGMEFAEDSPASEQPGTGSSEDLERPADAVPDDPGAALVFGDPSQTDKDADPFPPENLS